MTKVKKNRKPYTVLTSERRPLYLLKLPISFLQTNQLPTNGAVLRHYQYLISKKSKRFMATATNFSCPQNKQDMICKDASCIGETTCLLTALFFGNCSLK